MNERLDQAVANARWRAKFQSFQCINLDMMIREGHVPFRAQVRLTALAFYEPLAKSSPNELSSFYPIDCSSCQLEEEKVKRVSETAVPKLSRDLFLVIGQAALAQVESVAVGIYKY
ncbi:hypothetical protein VNO78_36372 [Psophocarpus tetragonolobus]|uniref:Uncharacterized protein n=1 Tax=Psophocarpus tetragonolobus TaxID=3891 RepID=A0AAN9NKZ8_PSOTE